MNASALKFIASKDLFWSPKVTTYSRFSVIDTIEGQFDDVDNLQFSSGIFSTILNLSTRLKYSHTLVHYVLMHAVETKKKYEMWFNVKGNVLPFSLQDFAAITGLKCTEFEDHLIPDDPIVCGFGSRAPTLDDIIAEFATATGERKMVLAHLIVVEGVLLPQRKGSPVRQKYLKLASNLEVFVNYSWGREVYLETIQALQNAPLNGKRTQGSLESDRVWYTLFGFPLAFMVWILEHFHQFRDIVGAATSTEKIIPYGDRWFTLHPKLAWFNTVSRYVDEHQLFCRPFPLHSTFWDLNFVDEVKDPLFDSYAEQMLVIALENSEQAVSDTVISKQPDTNVKKALEKTVKEPQEKNSQTQNAGVKRKKFITSPTSPPVVTTYTKRPSKQDRKGVSLEHPLRRSRRSCKVENKKLAKYVKVVSKKNKTITAKSKKRKLEVEQLVKDLPSVSKKRKAGTSKSKSKNISSGSEDAIVLYDAVRADVDGILKKSKKDIPVLMSEDLPCTVEFPASSESERPAPVDPSAASVDSEKTSSVRPFVDNEDKESVWSERFEILSRKMENICTVMGELQYSSQQHGIRLDQVLKKLFDLAMMQSNITTTTFEDKSTQVEADDLVEDVNILNVDNFEQASVFHGNEGGVKSVIVEVVDEIDGAAECNVELVDRVKDLVEDSTIVDVESVDTNPPAHDVDIVDVGVKVDPIDSLSVGQVVANVDVGGASKVEFGDIVPDQGADSIAEVVDKNPTETTLFTIVDVECVDTIPAVHDVDIVDVGDKVDSVDSLSAGQSVDNVDVGGASKVEMGDLVPDQGVDSIAEVADKNPTETTFVTIVDVESVDTIPSAHDVDIVDVGVKVDSVDSLSVGQAVDNVDIGGASKVELGDTVPDQGVDNIVEVVDKNPTVSTSVSTDSQQHMDDKPSVNKSEKV